MPESPYQAVVRGVQHRVADEVLDAWSDEQVLHRFLANGDQMAFRALVQRHGSMILRLCRQVLGNAQDADDAFQATFLALIHQGKSIRKQTSLASWLYGVAYRLCRKAQRSAARRRLHERKAEPMGTSSSETIANWSETQAILAEEIAGLPEHLRGAFVLCVQEGMGRAEAATRLAVKEGTLSSRIDAAKKLLQERLTKRGVELGAVLAALSVSTSTGLAAAQALGEAILASAQSLAIGLRVSELSCSSAVIQLVQEAAKMFWWRSAAVYAAMAIAACVGFAAVGPTCAPPCASPRSPTPRPSNARWSKASIS